MKDAAGAEGWNEAVTVDMPQDQYSLYAVFGMAAEKAQVLETEAGNVALFYVSLLVNTDEITPEETAMFRSLMDDVNRKTLGALLSHIKKQLKLDDAMISILDDGMEQRNYLTHRFFRFHNFALFSAEGRKVMLADLITIQTKLDRAHTTLSLITQILNEIAGRPRISDELALHFQKHGKKIDI
jgi:hypothetical protein